MLRPANFTGRWDRTGVPSAQCAFCTRSERRANHSAISSVIIRMLILEKSTFYSTSIIRMMQTKLIDILEIHLLESRLDLSFMNRFISRNQSRIILLPWNRARSISRKAASLSAYSFVMISFTKVHLLRSSDRGRVCDIRIPIFFFFAILASKNGKCYDLRLAPTFQIVWSSDA